jgi:hypothetical protein
MTSKQAKMQLKRGTRRGSCDFCFRRKMKCDRAVRASQGYLSCSHCDIRQIQCHLDESTDLRIQKRNNLQDTGNRGTRDELNNSPVVAQGPTTPLPVPQTDSITTPSSFITSIASSSEQPTSQTSPEEPKSTVDIHSWDQLLGISTTSASFLDQIFISDDYQPTMWADQTPGHDSLGQHLQDISDRTGRQIFSW